jgi:hypothetical protein
LEKWRFYDKNGSTESLTKATAAVVHYKCRGSVDYPPGFENRTSLQLYQPFILGLPEEEEENQTYTFNVTGKPRGVIVVDNVTIDIAKHAVVDLDCSMGLKTTCQRKLPDYGGKPYFSRPEAAKQHPEDWANIALGIALLSGRLDSIDTASLSDDDLRGIAREVARLAGKAREANDFALDCDLEHANRVKQGRTTRTDFFDPDTGITVSGSCVEDAGAWQVKKLGVDMARNIMLVIRDFNRRVEPRLADVETFEKVYSVVEAVSTLASAGKSRTLSTIAGHLLEGKLKHAASIYVIYGRKAGSVQKAEHNVECHLRTLDELEDEEENFECLKSIYEVSKSTTGVY